MSPQISVPLKRISPLIEQAKSAGLNIEKALADLKIDVKGAANTKESISLGDYYRLHNTLALKLGDETLRLSARNLVPGSTDYVLQHTRKCKTLVEAMEVIAKSYNLLHGGDYNRVVKKRDRVDYIVDDRSFPYALDQDREYLLFSTECVLIFLHCMLMSIAPAAADAVLALHIKRRTPGGDCGHLGYWSAPIRFGADVYRLSLKRGIAFAAIAPSPSALTSLSVYGKIVETVAGKEAQNAAMAPASTLVKAAFAENLWGQDVIAARLGLSVASLRRRLSDEGMNFRDLRQQVLNEKARALLSGGGAVSEVAEQLGFSDFRAFNRAFKLWNGVTPAEFRGQNGDTASK
ncbi:MAG: helix-turn-helix domain-containing protein [Pseudomonadota bacterium]